MVFGQEPVSSICQLWDPGIQTTQVQFIKQFTTSLPNCQPMVWGSWDSSAPSSNCSSTRGSCTGNVATALATGVFFRRVCKYAVLFLTTMTALLLPCLNSVYIFCTVRPCGKEPSSVHKACTMMLMHSPM